MRKGILPTKIHKTGFGKDSLINSISIVYGYKPVISMSGLVLDQEDTGDRELFIGYNINLLPNELSLSDLLICIAEEIRMQLERDK